MNLSPDACAVSCYREIGVINAEHNITLVQHNTAGAVYVKKVLTVFNAEIYRYLQEHPVKGMPEIVEAVEEDGRLIVIEEYISGQTLQSILDSGNVFPEEDAVTITERVCRIVRQLHGAVPPILHRDIKPSNIMRMPDGGIRLLDLNAARRADPKKAQDTELIGTVGYAAPEQYGFGTSVVQTDIYSIGVLLCVLATGALPREKMPRGKLGRIVRRCTRIDPKDRYKSVNDLLEALSFCHGRPARKAEDAANVSFVRRFMIPGFRKRNPAHIMAAVIVYIFFLRVCLTFTAEGIPPGPVLWTVRIIYLLFVFLMILFTGNYLDVWDLVRISRIRNILLRLLVVFAIDAVLAVIMFFTMVLTVVALGGFTG